MATALVLASVFQYVLCVYQGYGAVLGQAQRGGRSLDREHGRGEELLPTATEHQLHHRQPDRGL